MSKKPESILEGDVKIPTLPSIYNEINETVEDPESSFTDIGRIISGDTSLSARLLQIVNSSFYGFPSQIETITHAVTIVGTAQLRDLILATMVMSQFKGVPKDLVNMELFWSHSVACGLAARIIAVYRREPNAERYYVTGILHDLGRLVLFLNGTEQMKEVIDATQGGEVLVYDAERSIFGFDHADVGSALLNKWGLSDRLGEVVCYHHRPREAPNYPLDAAIIHLADLIVHAMELGHSGERFVPPLDPQAWDKIELPSSLMASIVEQLDRQYEDTIRMFLSDN
ncbi:MAG: HDOD domain-containing protein [Nitrospinae bacterium]|nr:HDOD domain-containing protein [Nitrospinota bacterium]